VGRVSMSVVTYDSVDRTKSSKELLFSYNDRDISIPKENLEELCKRILLELVALQRLVSLVYVVHTR
jgi:hypothetical protein